MMIGTSSLSVTDMAQTSIYRAEVLVGATVRPRTVFSSCPCIWVKRTISHQRNWNRNGVCHFGDETGNKQAFSRFPFPVL